MIIVIIITIIIVSAASPVACGAAQRGEDFCPVISGLGEPAEARAALLLPYLLQLPWDKLGFSSKTLFL